MIKVGDKIKYRRNGIIYEGVVSNIHEMSKDGRIVIDLTNGFGIFSTELVETQYDKKGKPVEIKDACQCCNGAGILNGGPDKPSVVCSNCHGSGKYYSQEDKDDMVNHPKHYTFGTIEVITVIEDWQLGFHEGNCIKYIARAKHKGNELENLKKAQWYLNRKIKDIELEIAAADDK
jgi:hypothetical protein